MDIPESRTKLISLQEHLEKNYLTGWSTEDVDYSLPAADAVFVRKMVNHTSDCEENRGNEDSWSMHALSILEWSAEHRTMLYPHPT